MNQFSKLSYLHIYDFANNWKLIRVGIWIHFILLIPRKVLIIPKSIVAEKRLRIRFYIWILSQRHQDPILCFVPTKFTIIYSLLIIYFNTLFFIVLYLICIVIKYFDNFVNGFMYETFRNDCSSMMLLGMMSTLRVICEIKFGYLLEKFRVICKIVFLQIK